MQAAVVVDQGAPGVDFAVGSGGTCTSGAQYPLGQHCTVAVLFQPRYPGLCAGAVEILGTNGQLLGSTLVSALATGSLPVFLPGNINLVAGNGFWTYAGDGMSALQAQIFLPMGVVVDPAGNVYISDTNNNRLRRVDAATGLISTIAGNGIAGYSGDGGPADQAMISGPTGVTLDGAGNIFFADAANHIIRRVDAITGHITTVAGTPGASGWQGDGSAATDALLHSPEGLAFAASGNLLIADTGNHVIRMVDATTGNISTIAGTGVAGFNGDGQSALNAQLDTPWGVAAGANGAVYIADLNNNRIRLIDSTGQITTVAGNGVRGFLGDGGTALSAELNAPAAVVLDPAGDLFIADSANNTVRRVNASDGSITSIINTVGVGEYAGDGSPSTESNVAAYAPYALSLGKKGDLFFADVFDNRIREISAASLNLAFSNMQVGTELTFFLPLSLTNEGNAALTLNQPTESNAALIAGGSVCNTGLVMGPAAVCSYEIAFEPVAVGSPAHGSLVFNSDSSQVAPTISLQGNVSEGIPTSVVLVSSLNPGAVNQPITLTAGISSSPAPGVSNPALTGTVIFFDGTTQICSLPLTSSLAVSCTTSALSLGQHSLTATYSGDTNYAASVSAPLLQSIKQPAVAVLSVAPNPSVVTSNVTLTATVTSPGYNPTGTVTFLDGATAIGVGAVGANGVATFSTVSLSPGTHSLSAQYGGDTIDAPSQSTPVSDLVQQLTTTTTLSSSNATATVGAGITFSALVADGNGSTITGTVQFTAGATLIGSALVANNGIAKLVVAALPPGTYNVVASYSGDTNNAASTSTALVETIQQIPTTTLLSSTATQASFGTPIRLTANVSMVTGSTADGVISGSITFTNGSTVLGAAPVDTNGNSNLTLTNLPVGQDLIVATYSGNANYASSFSLTLAEQISKASTTTVVTSSNQSLFAGQAVTFTATVASIAGIPTGTVSFFDGSINCGQGLVSANGTATLTLSTLAVGSHVLTAVYSGDNNYLTSTSSLPVALLIQATPTAISLSSSANPQIVGQSVTLTATATSISSNLSGLITFSDEGKVLGSVAIDSHGGASFTTASLALGSHNLTATYSGDLNHATSTSLTLIEQIVQSATAALTSSPNPSTAGTTVVFSVALTGIGEVIPTGSVTFSDSGVSLGTVALASNGVAVFQTSSLAVGSRTITASYGGDKNYAAVSATLIQTVQSATTQITLTSGSNPAIYSQPLAITATIISDGGIPSGSVSFVDAGILFGTAVLNANGVATLTTSTLAPGAHSIVANYAGDGRASASSSTPLGLVVKQLTTVKLASATNPTQTISPIILGASISNSGVGIPTGIVSFFDGAAQLGTAIIDGTGTATLTVPSLAAGSHTLVANYVGDSINFAGTSGALIEQVQQRPTTTALTATQTNVSNPLQVTLVSEERWSGTVTPTGTVTFMSGTNIIGSSAVDSVGIATLTIFLESASENVTAIYSGDASYSGSSSPTINVIAGPATQFTAQLDPASMTVQSQQHGITTLTMTSIQGFADTIRLGCAGQPATVTCTFSNDQVPLAAGGKAVVQLTIDTGDPLGAGQQANGKRSQSPGIVMCFIPIGLLAGLALFRTRHRSLCVLLTLVCASIAVLGASGCGGLTINSVGPGTYMFDLTAVGQGTGATVTQIMTLTVTK